MRLTKLDLFMYTPDHDNAWPYQRPSIGWWTWSYVSLNQDLARKVAIAIMESVSCAQRRPLRQLTMHLSRSERSRFSGGSQACFQFRSTKERPGKYEFRGRMEWDRTSFEDELLMEED